MARAQRGTGADGPVRRLARFVLLGWVAFYVVLSADVLFRILRVRHQMEHASDGFTLVAIEGARTAALIAAFVVVAAALRFAGRIRGAGLFAALVAFLAVWYARTFSFPGYPGHFQEWLAGRLIATGVPPTLLDFLFAAPEWSLWLALGALLRLSVSWPRSLDAAGIVRSGMADRRGMLRTTAIAGADIGAGFRALAAGFVSYGLYRPQIVWTAVIVAGAVHSQAAWPAVRLIMAGAIFVGFALAITNARAALGQSTRRQRRRILWTTTATVVAGSAFLVSATLSFGADTGSAIIGMTIASLAPAAVLILLLPALRRSPPRAGSGLRRAVLVGACGCTGAIAYLLSMATLPGPPSAELPIRELLALMTSAVLVAVTIPRLRQITDKLTPPLPT